MTRKSRPRRSQPRRLPRSARTASIITAARASFLEKGFDGASTAEIAVRAGIVEGTIYRYFKSKQDLLVRVVEDWYERMLAEYDQQLGEIPATRDRFRFMVWWHLKIIHTEPAMSKLIFGEFRAHVEYRHTSVFKFNRAYTGRMMHLIEEAVQTGRFRGVNPAVVRDLIFGGVEHSAFAFLRDEGDFSPGAVADAITDVVYHGLTRPPTSADVTRSDSAGLLQQATRCLEILATRMSVPA